MSNSGLVDVTKISSNKTTPRSHKIDTITIHCTAGKATAQALADWFYPSARGASSNYGVGEDGRIGMFVEEKDRSWCSSNSSNDNRAVTIEVSSENIPPYKVTDKVLDTTIKLVADICQRNNILELIWKADKSLVGKPEQQNMTVHRWFANKSCPGDYLYERMGYIADQVNKILRGEDEDDDMTLDRFTELMNEYRNTLRDNDASDWSKDARDWAIKEGIIVGGDTLPNGEPNYMHADFLTREQMVVIIKRLYDMLK